MAIDPAEPPFLRIGPATPASPIILSVPHAGRNYSQALLKASRLRRETLETLEDPLVDRLVWRAVQAGATAFIAQAPRAEIDLNRNEREIDPSLVAPPLSARAVVQSARTRGGLGLIPSRIPGAGSIWLQRIRRDELDRRIAHIHRPYHDALEDILRETRARFGVAILLDCHSMPPRATGAGGAALVFGDRHGTTMAPDLLKAAVAAAEGLGFRTARNVPYAGGHIVTHHGRPETGIHALQMEIDRAAYLAPDMRAPGEGFDAVAALIAAVAAALCEQALGPSDALAAE